MTMESSKPHPDVSPSRATQSTDDAIETQAATWFVRRQGDHRAEDEAAFQAWLALSPTHRLAYEQVANAWQALDQLPEHDVARLRAGFARAEPVTHNLGRPALTSPARRSFVPRFALAGTAFAFAGGSMLGWNYWRNNPTFTERYETRRGEFQTVSLPDGSTMELDTETHVEARLFRHRREVQLVRGQAMFTVQSDADRPFNVLARTVTVTVVGTRFAVRCTDTGLENGNVRVEVAEGRVRVGSAPAGGGLQRVVELAAGQAVVIDADGLLDQVNAISPTEVAAWRQGRVTFDNTPLLRALQEFERYETTNIVISDPAVGAMRLTGSFNVGQVDRFAHALPRVLPVRLRARGNVTEIVRSA